MKVERTKGVDLWQCMRGYDVSLDTGDTFYLAVQIDATLPGAQDAHVAWVGLFDFAVSQTSLRSTFVREASVDPLEWGLRMALEVVAEREPAIANEAAVAV